jgi:L-iditol 2-dehydrogenase
MMQALVKYGNVDGEVELRDVAEPQIGPGDVLLEVAAASVCGSDIHMYHHHISYLVNVPVIMGHEFVGVVREVGAEVKGFQVGERVASETSAIICGHCLYCRSGNYQLCPERLGFGYGTDGAFTRYVKVRQEILHHLPDNVSFEVGSMTEPLCVAYNALVENSRIKPGDLTVILGPGPIGLMALLIAKASGAAPVIVTGLRADAKRLAVAEGLGADRIVYADEEDPIQVVKSYDDGLGADLVVDAVGFSVTLRQALEMVRPQGQITKIGWDPKPVGFSIDRLVGKSATLQGTYSHNYPVWERALKLLSQGVVNPQPMIGGVYPLGEWREAFDSMERMDNVKSVIVPQ